MQHSSKKIQVLCEDVARRTDSPSSGNGVSGVPFGAFVAFVASERKNCTQLRFFGMFGGHLWDNLSPVCSIDRMPTPERTAQLEQPLWLHCHWCAPQRAAELPPKTTALKSERRRWYLHSARRRIIVSEESQRQGRQELRRSSGEEKRSQLRGKSMRRKSLALGTRM